MNAFSPRDPFEPATGGAWGAASASAARAQILLSPPGWRERLDALDWAPDLASDIGSRRWFRGLATLLGLIALAFLLRPHLGRIAGDPPVPLTADMRAHYAALTFNPLVLGADSGRRTAPTALVRPVADAPERTSETLIAVLNEGDTLGNLLARAGVDGGDAARAAALIGSAIPLPQIAPGTQIDMTLGRRPAPLAPRSLDRLTLRARFDLDLAVTRSAAGALQLERHPIAVDTTPLRIRGTVGASLYRSARAAGAPIEAVAQYLQVLDQHLSLDTEMAPGDTFDMVVAYKRAAGGEVQAGDLLYAGLERGGVAVAQLLRWGSDGQFFEASGMGAQRTGLIMPVVGHIPSEFGLRRHPILGYTRLHAGVDFGAAYGSPIYAVGDGVVTWAGWHGGHGNFVRLDHGNGYGTGYGHMSRIAVSVGMHVRAGQVIGYVGSTGRSTGPHLHYEIHIAGKKVNPLGVKMATGVKLAGKQLAAFKAVRAKVSTQMAEAPMLTTVAQASDTPKAN
jgi:murein DD-endopeptidase MepM/ murein hydrolase activator NlpD